ncbi:MAG: D-aminoacyl-tRNA deacylase [Coriobacteriia bacterium]|nr:D-aminoacyl-tRNA deacylase [Coriobacteriia bacterium]
MRALIQRVSQAQVSIDGEVSAQIKQGLLIFLGVGSQDSLQEAEKLWSKISKLRIFEDENGKTNLAASDVASLEMLVVSQFTLYASMKKGNRPSFTNAAPPELARNLYEAFVDKVKADFPSVQTGSFGAYMQVELVNDGPFTIWLDTDEL